MNDFHWPSGYPWVLLLYLAPWVLCDCRAWLVDDHGNSSAKVRLSLTWVILSIGNETVTRKLKTDQ